jgi:hypothetical protein
MRVSIFSKTMCIKYLVPGAGVELPVVAGDSAQQVIKWMAWDLLPLS